MRHFAHHIGDYAAATAHLSMLEDAAYHRLLRLYYQNEAPLTSDENELMRRVRAVSRHEKNAVRSVLQEFFTLSSDGWHQSRADSEISNFKHLVEAGRKGGLKSRLPKASSETELTTTQEPLPITHSIPRQARKTKLPDDWKATEELLAYAAEQGCADPLDTAERFRLHHQSKGTLGIDWNKGFQFWCRNQKTFTRANGTRPTGYPQSLQTTTTNHDDPHQWRARLRGYNPTAFWNQGDWGPRPGEAGCRVPKPILDEWRGAQT